MPRPAPGLQRIVRTAERLFARHGYDGVSVAEVARVAGVSKAAVFHHFPRKIDLYRTIFSSAASDFRRRMAPALDFSAGVREGVLRFLRARARSNRGRSSAVRLVMREMAEGSSRLRGALRQADVAESYRVVERALEDAQRRGLIRERIDCRTAAHLLIMSSSPLFGFSRSLREARGADEDRIAGSMVEILAGGLACDTRAASRAEARSA